jgi:hypothetical protein
LREYKYTQLWVLIGKTDQLMQVYENTWKELVDQLGYPKSKLHDESETSKKMPPSSDVTRCKKRQKLMVLPSDQDVKAYNPSCSSPSLVESSLVTPPRCLSNSPHPVKEITTNTPSALSALSVNSNHSPSDAHTMFNILAHNNRLEDVVAGLSLQNQMLSSELQSACATNSQLVSDEEEKQELLDEEEEKEQEQEEEQGQKQEAAAPISKWDIVTNRSRHLKYKNGHDQFKKILNQATGRGKYYGTPLGKKLYAHAAALSPQISFKNLEMILALN